MNRNEIIEELSTLKYRDKPVYYNKGNGTLKKIEEFDDKYLLSYYSKFHCTEYKPKLPKFNYGTFEQYRGHIIKLLEYCQIKNIDIKEFGQEDLDKFFNTVNSSGKMNTRKSATEAFFENYNMVFNYNSIEKRINDGKKDEEKNRVLTFKEIEGIRRFYKDNKFRLFIFEWIYSLGFNKEEFGEFKVEDFDYINKTVIVGGEKNNISEYIVDLINDVKDNYRMNRTKSVFDINLPQMEEELAVNGIIEGRLKQGDIAKTREQTFSICPECGSKYESTAENWVIKIYSNSDIKWIVCKAKCGKVDDE